MNYNTNQIRRKRISNREILNRYIPIIDFIADICGTEYEVVLHDITTPEASVIAIKNDHITGREIGSPITDLALKILKQKYYVNKNFITNYNGIGPKNEIFSSSTYFIKNDDEELIGLICVNNDLTAINNFKSSFENLMKRFEYNRDEENSKYEENIDNPLISVANSIINKTINSMNIPASRMSIEEKIEIVQQLNNEGIFLLKGAVTDIAKLLDISETTVYRYLNKK